LSDRWLIVFHSMWAFPLPTTIRNTFCRTIPARLIALLVFLGAWELLLLERLRIVFLRLWALQYTIAIVVGIVEQ
jgi:hypothetical protein